MIVQFYSFHLLQRIFQNQTDNFKYQHHFQTQFINNMRSKHIKTQASYIGDHQFIQHSINCVSSARKVKHLNQTPLRFADIALKQKDKHVDTRSTNDREKSQRSQFSKNRVNSEISQAIGFVYDNVDVLKQLSEGKYKQQVEPFHKIRPFEVVMEEDQFQEELSFKGVTNRHHLLQKLQQMEDKIGQITTIIYTLHGNKHIDYISNRLSIQQTKNTNMRKIFFDFYTHLQALINEVNDFSIELTRCSSIVKHAKGISSSTAQLYVSKFDTVICQMGKKLNFLRHYVEILEAIYKQQIKKSSKKISFTAIHIS